MRSENSYRQFLQNEWVARSGRNPSYSLSAYARDLGLSPSSLSRVLSGAQGLSLARARKIAKEIDLSESETEHFCAQVEAHHGRSQLTRKIAARTLRTQTPVTGLDLDRFQLVSEWYSIATLEALQLTHAKFSAAWVASSLGITEQQAKESIQRLIQLKLIDSKTGKKKSTYLATPNGIPSRALKNFHRQVLTKALNAIDEQSVQTRDLSAVTFPMNQEDLVWAKSELQAFRKKLTTRLSKTKKKNSLYLLSIQLFSLLKEPS